uniref:Saposin B-type domain-containing protein n=1 Tax=Tetradesmus obliquus TaxID=3088 RepID=A0A383WPZ6_TETOB|eukprot:jgi/Sobl393_1/6400/SZX79501.1
MQRHLALLLLACSIVLQLSSHAAGMMPGMGMGGMPEQPKAAAVVSDVKYIKCGVCEALMKQATRKVKAMRGELKPGQRVDESAIIENLELACNPAKPDGAWITHYDMVEDGDRIKLVDTQQASKCNTECATIARACSQVTDSLDLSDLSEALYSGKSRSALTQLACYEMSNACRVKPPPVPKDRAPGPAHTPMSAGEAEREAMMARMKAAGLGGQMYNREDLMQQMQGLQQQADDGEIASTPMTEMSGDAPAAAAGSVADTVVETMAKAGEVVGDAVAQAKDAAAAAVGKASSFLKDKLKSFGGVRGEAEL